MCFLNNTQKYYIARAPSAKEDGALKRRIEELGSRIWETKNMKQRSEVV